MFLGVLASLNWTVKSSEEPLTKETYPDYATATNVTIQGPGGRYYEITNFLELMGTLGQTGTPGYILMICGFDPKKPNNCGQVLEHFQNLTLQFPIIKSDVIFYNLSVADLEVTKHFYVNNIPQIIFVKDRRVWYYEDHEYSNAAVAQFAYFFTRRPDHFYRDFPDKPRTYWRDMINGLWRINDKVKVMTKGNKYALGVMYTIFGGVAFMFLIAIGLTIDEVFTGRWYRNNKALINRDSQEKELEPSHADHKATPQASKSKSIHDLKVKHE